MGSDLDTIYLIMSMYRAQLCTAMFLGALKGTNTIWSVNIRGLLVEQVLTCE
jgi:hypothetical protein